MAKSFMDQLLDMVGLKVPDAHGHYSPSVYKEEHVSKEPSEKTPEAAQATPRLTGVAKYLANKYPEEQQEVAQTAASATVKLTGVARYLAKLQQEEQEKAEAEAAALASMTGVARYLARLEGNIASTSSKTETAAEPASTASLTRVEKYLAKQQITTEDVAQPEAVQQVTEAKVTEQKPVVEEQKTQPKKEAEKKSTPAAKKPDTVINLAEDAVQCQSTTSKGTQCRRKTNLDTIEKTINDQKYKFLACSQHHGEGFIPFAEILQEG